MSIAGDSPLVVHKYRTKPLSVLIGAVAFIAAAYTGVLIIAIFWLPQLGEAVPAGAIRGVKVGIPITALLVGLTALVAKFEPNRTIFTYLGPERKDTRSGKRSSPPRQPTTGDAPR